MSSSALAREILSKYIANGVEATHKAGSSWTMRKQSVRRNSPFQKRTAKATVKDVTFVTGLNNLAESLRIPFVCPGRPRPSRSYTIKNIKRPAHDKRDSNFYTDFVIKVHDLCLRDYRYDLPRRYNGMFESADDNYSIDRRSKTRLALHNVASPGEEML